MASENVTDPASVESAEAVSAKVAEAARRGGYAALSTANAVSSDSACSASMRLWALTQA
jgi:hypothetical protein